MKSLSVTLIHLLDKYSLAFKYMQASVLSFGNIKTIPSFIKIESTGKDRHRTDDHKWKSS